MPKAITPVCMALDDLLANIISYGYDDDSHHLVSVKVWLGQGFCGCCNNR